jgi:phosphotransferase system  glucose/maltose/N-acetylglucosamine-specific IIC component
MKKQWYALLDSMKLPLAVLLIGHLLMGLNVITVNNTLVSTMLETLKYIGYFMVDLLPLIVIIAYFGRKFEDSAPVNAGILCYLILNVITMFFSRSSLASYFYTDLFSLGLDADTTIRPLNMGLLASVIVIFIVNFTYRSSRKRYNYGILPFISNDVWFLISAMLFTGIAGALIVWQYPTIARFVVKCMRFVAVNNTNPASLFLYSLYDKVMSLTGLHGIVEKGFWFGEFGGSWVDSSAVSYVGDASIWNAQIAADTLAKGVGRYSTNYYVVNLFMIPALLLGYLLTIRDKFELRRTWGTCLVGLVCSLLCGSALPVELTLLFIAPGLLGIHVILSSLSSMALALLNVQLGFTVTAGSNYASAGTLLDFIRYFRAASLHSVALKVLIVGAICFVVYLLLVFLYYRFMSQDFLDSEEGKREMKAFVKALGGLNNIKMLTYSPLSIIAVLHDNEKLDPKALLETRAFLVKERYFGYHIEYGPGSPALCRMIRKEKKELAEVMAYHREA